MHKAVETTLAARIDQAINSAGMTNEQVAERMDCSHGNVSHWRNGRHRPDVEQLLRLAATTGVSDYWLLTGRDDPANLLRAYHVARSRWEEAVRGGADPSAAWQETLGQPGLLSLEEREALSRNAAELREFLVSVDGRRWVELTGEQHRIVRDLVDLFGRTPTPADGQANPDQH